MPTQITTCSAYTAYSTLRNVVDKIVAGSHVNVHAVEAFGKTIIRDIIGNSVFAYKFRRKYRAKALGNSLAVKIASNRAFILLFCSSVFCWCKNLEILPLQSYRLLN
ncbi:hypothetical protein DPMN_128087 [Dreissena polymorpha]|uniref:Uncharacterized protein n=1 Tax=Dreissena polymorpha TaxID=45954 RepID=A0A9D4JW25_DREPO|nr:hypothetical protein DPMN_128087 [Dreissena polymorpha]